MYGKVGAAKGNFDLIAALGRLARAGVAFSFLSVSCGRLSTLQSYYEATLEHQDLKDRTWILPPIAPWRIPAFLARCDAVTFLEREFSIPFHGPMVPLEVLSSDACLVCSGEIAAKQFYRGNLVDDRNAVIVADPRDHEQLANTLLRIIQDRGRTQSIGAQGHKLYRFFSEDLRNHDASTAGLADQIAKILSPHLCGRS